MGKRGPAPTPTKVLKLRGSWRAKKREAEPKPQVELPTCPAHLSAEAKREWNRISKELLKLGLITKIDRAMLAGYCDAYGRWVQATKKLQKEGMVVLTPNGFPVQSPWMQIINKSLMQMKQFAAEFGLSPSSRSSIKIAPEKEADPLEEFVAKKA